MLRHVDLCTDEVLDFWLGEASNKQARINLYYECKYNPETLKDVLDHWKMTEEDEDA
jgi:hypothetical protein|tara:strand:+ start:171 stop:341 length:171 start_codon:yes stop_codon:yes gene_type:complete